MYELAAFSAKELTCRSHVISHAFWSSLGLCKIQSQGTLKRKKEFQAFGIFTPDTIKSQQICKTENNFLWEKQSTYLLPPTHVITGLGGLPATNTIASAADVSPFPPSPQNQPFYNK